MQSCIYSFSSFLLVERMSVEQDVGSFSNSTTNTQPIDTTPKNQDVRNTSTTQNDSIPKKSNSSSRISGCWKCCIGACKLSQVINDAVEEEEED